METIFWNNYKRILSTHGNQIDMSIYYQINEEELFNGCRSNIYGENRAMEQWNRIDGN